MKAPRIEDYYQSADQFFQNNLPVGLTYDDVSLATLYSDVLPRQTTLATRLSASLELQIPVISSDMDTVTESKMAIQMALNGGLGLIHYNMSDEEQVREVTRVKNHIHGFIQEPIKVAPDQKIGEVMERIADRGSGRR
jgi:IMP dehydrogenase